MRRIFLGVTVAGVLFGVPALQPASAATCAQYSNQAAAQAAADTRDADGDGIYCESLPCPCSSGAGGGGTTAPPPPPPPATSCTRPRDVQDLVFSRRAYPNIRRHAMSAIAEGWPSILVVNRPGDGARRDRVLRNIPTKPGYDRDEYPPAVGRGRANGDLRGLVQGEDPKGWKADVEYVGSHENRSQGAVMGAQLRRFCNGTRFRYVWR